MKILVGGQWRTGYLDWHRGPGEYRVKVLALRNLERVRGQYISPRRTVRALLTYVREVGVHNVWLRVRSRSAERGRNEKYVSCGFGEVLEAPDDGGLAVGTRVLFIAPAHPACAERLVLPPALVRPLGGQWPEPPADAIAYRGCDEGAAGGWAELAGWSPQSGVELDAERCRGWLDRAQSALLAQGLRGAEALPVSDRARVVEAVPAPRPEPRPGELTAVLFGYGNYAKVTSLPRLGREVRVTAVHEMDPLQIPNPRPRDRAWDTSPTLRPHETPDLVLIAGYHHTHAGLAVEALRRGAYAVVEKPPCTTHEQLDALLEAMRPGPSRVFACFHRRYLRFNAMALHDLQVRPGEAVDYHCVVFEIPLPPLHWYRWPASRSRLLSNGSHWIDHFLFLNAWSPPRRWTVDSARNGAVTATVELENGAYFSMTLTDRGSLRTGVQDHVELRANDRTVRIESCTVYVAESTDGVLRRARAHKLSAYDAMYRAIRRAALAGAPGDSARSVELSSRLALDMDAALLSGRRPQPA